MRSLDDIRQRAWEVRAKCLKGQKSLLDGLIVRIQRHHKITLAPSHPNALEGGEAELQPPVLKYDEGLHADLAKLAYVLAHELGHLELHPRVKRRTYRLNPIAAAIYLRRQDVGAVAAYSHRLPEETEAITFANEMVCPAPEVFSRWREVPGTTLTALAEHFEVSEDLVAVQLTEALYREALGAAPSASDRPPRPHRKDVGQDEAVAHTDGPALVLAGPGTGKTRTLVRHAVHVLRTTRDVGDNLLILTFSNEAAEELRTRIAQELGGYDDLVSDRVTVFTFHAFGFYLVRLFHEQLGFAQPPTVLDVAGQQEVILDAFVASGADALLNLKAPNDSAERAAAHINHLKQRFQTPEWLLTTNDELAVGLDHDDQKPHALAKLWAEYERRKQELGRVDFADLVFLPTQLMKRDKGVLGLVREQFHRLLIDEYQDVSLATGELVRTVCLDEGGSVEVPAWVVGDPFQGIYAFLGADIRNITEFVDTFRAEEIGLHQSYRSCVPVVEAANKLARLMGGAGSLVPDPNVMPHGERAVRVAVAPTDAAEHQGVADLVTEWLSDDEVAPEDIAVLARRNVDVREIAKALGTRGISTTTSGIVTAEGAAGDVAAVLTFANDPASALPRLAFALGRLGTSQHDRNTVVARALAHLRAGLLLSNLEMEGSADQQRLTHELLATYSAAEDGAFSQDGFASITTFLFESSLYLRRVLDARDAATEAPDIAQANLALVEIATALGHAAAYRFSHPQTEPRKSRIGFASYFRRTLARSTPSAVAPRRTPGLVQVMTCHASKGLEFPLVVVAGQRLPGTTQRLAWLPPESLPIQSRPDDEVQADALLFVGLTRAERAVVVSYAHSPTATGRPSKLPKLLKDWIETTDVHTEEWSSVDVAEKSVMVSPVWGSSPDRRVRTRALAKPDKSCSIRSYIQNELGLSFPHPDPELYGVFVGRMRQFIGSLVEASHGRLEPLSREEGLGMLSDAWPITGLKDHRLALFYDVAAKRIAENFPGALDQSGLFLANGFVALDLDGPSTEYGVELSSGLAAHFLDAAARPTGIVFHLGSLAGNLNAKGTGVKWGTAALLRDRVELALLRSYYESTAEQEFQPYVYSFEDGALYAFAWPQKRYYKAEIERLASRISEFARFEYEHVVNHGQCERCSVRIACPFWMGADR